MLSEHEGVPTQDIRRLIMSLNSTPSSERIHIAFFGTVNAGKSSLVNAVTGQKTSIVSDFEGTTTDPVYKAMELLPLGAVMIIDTPGFDDYSAMGDLRMTETMRVLGKTDIAVLVIDSRIGKTPADKELIRLFEEKNIPYIIAVNKAELSPQYNPDENEILVSATENLNITELKNRIGSLAPKPSGRRIIGGLISPEDIVILVTPIDESAPKGRLILPQQQTIRDILDSDAIAVTVQPNQLAHTLDCLGKAPAMVVTDSQAFAQVSKIVPDDIPLTSFSILMAAYKGFLEVAVRGAKMLDNLRDGDRILISEGCTHHRQCNDIGTVKLPRLIRKYTGIEPVIDFTSGRDFPDNLSGYKLIIHCGGCMLSEREVISRRDRAIAQGIPFTNYGMAIAYMNGITERSLRSFPDLI
jgi:[FeFe] hydrogenase H-cluster maturation GTPase HydF